MTGSTNHAVAAASGATVDAVFRRAFALFADHVVRSGRMTNPAKLGTGDDRHATPRPRTQSFTLPLLKQARVFCHGT